MSKYGDALDAMDQDRERQAATVATVASKYNPDQYAQAVDKSQQLGVPARRIADNPEAYNRPSKYGAALDAQDAPATQEWLGNLDNAAVAQDDIESLSALERTMRMMRTVHAPKIAAARGLTDLVRSGSAGGVQTVGSSSSGMGRLLEAGGRYTERGIRAVGGDWLADTLSPDTPWWMTPSEILKRPGAVVKQAADQIDIPADRQNLATDIAGGVGQLGAQTITQLLTGGTASTAMLLGQGADIMGDRAEAAGATPEQTDAAVLMGASVTALTERYGLDALLNRVPPQIKSAVMRQITDLAIGGGIEAAQEAVEGVLHNLTAKALFDPNTPLFEGIDREALAAGGAGAIGRAVLNAIVPGRQVGFAESDRETAEQIATIAQQSKLAARSPGKLEELVAAIKAQTGTEFAYVDAEAFRTLYQSDQEAAQAAADLTGSQKTYFEAAVSGSRMAIPLEKYVSKIAANKESAKLLDFVSFTPEGLTADEAKASRETFDDRAKEIATQAIEQARPDSSQAIYDDALGQLIATGMERSTAEKNAALTQVVFRTLGQRTGMDAQQLYERYGLKVWRESVTGGTQLDQSPLQIESYGDIPAAADLSIVDRQIEAELAERIKADPQDAIAEYDSLPESDGGKIINTDLARELSPAYRADRTRSAAVHEPASYLAKQVYAKRLTEAPKQGKKPLVVFSAGGTGAGKTTGLAKDAESSSAQIIYDNNLSTLKGAAEKIDQALAAGKEARLVYTWRDPVDALVNGALPRAMRMGRTVPVTEHAKTHVGAAKTLKELVIKYADNDRVRFQVIDNSRGKDKAEIADLSVVPDLDYNAVLGDLHAALEKEFKVGRISEAVYRGTRGSLEEESGQARQGPVESKAGRVDRSNPEQERQGTTLDQRYDETRRGAIQFGADRQFTISLLEKADLSTFLHESGHFYLEVLADLAEDQNAPQQVKDDFAKILKWMGVKDRAGIQTDQHEQWARGFEAYLMEGKSPSVEMQSVFGRFRAWLVGVYRSLAKLNVNLTDDIRRVMDRLVATDEEIAAAEESQNYAPIFTNAEEAGMSPEEWAAYKDIATRAHQEATQEMTDRALKELTREQKAWWKEERGKMVDAVTAEVNQQPAYRALAFLQKGQNPDGAALPEGVQAAKLNKQALIDKYGKDFLKRLPRGLTAKDGLSPDVVAGLFGFDSGDAMVEALANARPKTQLVEMEADARMREKYGDMLTDGSLAEVAMKSVHTEGRAKVMAAELKALNRKRREVKPFVKAAKDAAAREQAQAREANAATLPDADEMRVIKAGVARIIQAKKVREIQPNLYRMAEAKAARKAFEFASKGKYEEAYQEKRRQILNHELFRAAVKAREEIDSIVQFMRGFDKKSTRERLAKAKGQYLEQIDALRERFDFSNVSNLADLKRDALSKWVAEQEAAGREVNVPEYLLSEARKTPYKELLLAELQGLHDAVKNIDHLARTKDRIMKNRQEAEWQDAKQELAERIDGQKGRAPPVSKFERSNLEEYGAIAQDMADSWLRPETIVEWLDGGESGPWHDYLMEPANNAEYRRETLREQILKPLRDLAENVTRKRRAELHEEIRIKSLGKSFNRRTLLSIALNMGNESNMDRLARGGFRDGGEVMQFTPESLQEILAALNAEDVKFLNGAWATVEQLWPETVEFQKRMGGLVPEKIQATPLQTKHGELTGGYWPVVYDSLATRAGQSQAESSDPIATIMGQNFTRASTKKGHLKGRTAVAGPLLLDYSAVVGRHTEQVITDITHREFALQAMKVLDDADLRLKLQDALGETAWTSLRGMVRHAVEQGGGFSEAANRGQERIMRRILSNTAVAALGFRAVTAWGNMALAPIQAGARIAPKYIALGLGKFYRHPIDATKFIQDSSEMMKQRAKNMDHTFNVVMETLKGQRGFRAKVAQAAMSMHSTADFLATHGLWLGRYQEALDAGETHDESVRLADKSIRQTQTAGAPKDLSAFERDPRYSWFKMFLGPMLIQGNRIRESFGRRGVVQNWPQAFGTLTAAWFLPAVMWDLMTGRGPDDEDDDGLMDDAGLWALRKQFFYPFMTMPFIRDAASLIERKIGGQYAEPRMTPLADAAYLVYQAGQTAAKETSSWMDGDEFDAGNVMKSSLRASGPLFGIPSNQIDVTGSYLYDLYTGDEEFENLGDLRYLAIRR